MTTAHFKNLPEALCLHLAESRQYLRIAICWFSHKDIFETLLTRLRAGVQIELLLEYDTQNICDGGLGFQQFIKTGGQLWARREAGLMHHKFALVDDRLLLTGSFNWTYNSNAENLLVSGDPALVAAFQEEFERLRASAKRIFKVSPEEAKVFSAFPLFENTQFQLADLRKKVSGGAGVWLVRPDKWKADKNLIFRENRLPFDAARLLAPYWTAYRMWDEALFDEEMEHLKLECSVNTLRDLRVWARRMKIGDVIFAIEKSARSLSLSHPSHTLTAVGIVQSHPQPFLGERFSSFRDVQWLKILTESPHLLREPVSAQPVARFRGSALRVLQEVFKKTNLL